MAEATPRRAEPENQLWVQGQRRADGIPGWKATFLGSTFPPSLCRGDVLLSSLPFNMNRENIHVLYGHLKDNVIPCEEADTM